MKKYTLVITFFLISFYNYAQVNLAQGNATSKDYYTEISFEFIKDKIIVPVEIEGKTYRFMFDTGAPNVLSKELFSKIKTKPLGSLPVSDSQNNESDLKAVATPLIKFGNVTFQNIPALVSDFNANEIFKCFKIDGFLGSNLIRNSIVQIDLKRKKIIFTDNKKKLSLNKKNSKKIKLLGSQKKPYLWIYLEAFKTGKDHVLIDTGMGGFYDLSLRSFNIFKKENVLDPIASSKGSSSFGIFGQAKKQEQKRVLIDEIEIVKTNFLNFVTTTTNDSNSRIGIDVFKYGVGTIDFINKRFYFNSYKETVDLKKGLFGFKSTIVDNKLVIGFVWDKDLKDKIAYGDQIIKINNTDFSGFNTCEFIMSDFKFNELNKITLTVKKKDGKEITLELQQKNY